MAQQSVIKEGDEIQFEYETLFGSRRDSGTVLRVDGDRCLVRVSSGKFELFIYNSEIIMPPPNEDLRQKAALESAWERIAREKGFFA